MTCTSIKKYRNKILNKTSDRITFLEPLAKSIWTLVVSIQKLLSTNNARSIIFRILTKTQTVLGVGYYETTSKPILNYLSYNLQSDPNLSEMAK